ncbi:cytoplasmic protein [Saccharopolyspora rhizosphaerae]|uniref:Cytoplasmic protein n=1 Tax=Saccharopolyspora rhizosphaerae TaxID=2492662 RepID=A0A3R8QSN7_9PSEU|nr:MSMEG_6728 family protein [Saccharopolyspora rhizosphaerae]RRO18667.1 cytoplasmic protein [Saccharopolyspora rhizosphaerae]
MQTFLPYPSFDESAAVLDDRRLGKQRVEALQVLRALTREGYGWQHHPAVAMWAGYEEALACYGLAMCGAWTVTGRPDTCEVSIREDLLETTGLTAVRSQDELAEAGELPPWWGDPLFHRSHQSALVRKHPEHYRRFFDGVPDDMPYVWPPSDRPRTLDGKVYKRS